MIRHLRSVVVTAIAALALGLTSDDAAAAPPGMPDTPLDLELKAAAIGNIFRLLADVSHREIRLDPCVKGAVDLRLQNTPLPLVFDALALKMGLVYDDEDGAIRVTCRDAIAGDASSERAAAVRVSLSERGAELPDVLQRLAASAKLEGVDYRASAKPKVSVTLESVQLSTAVKALADSTNLDIIVSRKRLVVREQG